MNQLLTNNEKNRVNSLLPEFLKQDCASLVAFLQEYYGGEEQSGRASDLINNITNNLDLDTVSEEKFLNELAHTITNNVPPSDIVTRKFLIKRLVDYYGARGNTIMVDAFFRLFFNKKVEIFEPYNQVLIPSAGAFEPNLFIRIFKGQTQNDPLNLKGKTIVQQTPNGQKLVEAFVIDVEEKVFDETVYILKIERGTVFGKFVKDLFIKDLDGNAYGTPYRTLKDFNILRGGTGYEIGDRIFARNLPKATFIAEVSGVGENGEIQNIKIITFGSGNTQDPALPRQLKDFGVSDVTGINDDSFMGEEYMTFGNRGQVFHYGDNSDNQYNELNSGGANYFFEDYNSFADGEYKNPRSTDTESQSFSNVEVNFASVIIKSDNGRGGEVSLNFDFLINTDGKYLNSVGRLSNDTVIQDSYFWQKFSYEFKTDIEFSNYKSFYADLLHPAGHKIFHNVKKDIPSSTLKFDSEFNFGKLEAIKLDPDEEAINIPSTLYINNQNYYEIDNETPRNYMLEDYLETSIRIDD